MGVWGWDEISDGVKVQGFITGGVTIDKDDSDWNFSVDPANGFRNFLTNAHGNTNQNGLIQCEVEPAQHLKTTGTDVGSEPVANFLFGHQIPPSPDRTWTTVVGTFAVDRSHSVSGDAINTLGGDSTIGKTEIHPVTSALIEHPLATDNSARSIDFLVFSDDSKDRTFVIPPVPVPPFGLPGPPTTASTAAPHAGENRSGGFDIPIPAGTSFTTSNVVDRAQSHSITQHDSNRVRTVSCRVASGTPQDGQGFFHITVILPGFTLLTYLLSRGIDPTAGVRGLMGRAKVPSIRALFQRLDAGTL